MSECTSECAKSFRLLEIKIQHEREMREQLGQAVDRARTADREALLLQAQEYSRRLDALNHEATRIKEAAALSVSAERYEAERKGDQRVIEDLTKTIHHQKEELVRIATLVAAIVSLLGIAASYAIQ